MPPLRDVQHAMRRSMIGRDDADASIYIVADGISAQDRLSVYRNTFVQTLIRALRLSYPAIDRLVGAEFFDAAALDFITAQPPRSAYLDEYGGDFPAFLERFAPAASVPYLADVARLEWAVSHALHAPDAPALAIASLGAVDAADYAEIRFEPHPSVGLVHTEFPADTIWRAVLDDDAAVLAVLDLSNGPAWLIVQRSESGVEVDRVDEAAWLFVHALCARQPLGLALGNHRGIDAQTVLADLLAHGRFTGFNLAPQPSRRNR
jgi:hypothetical protein